MKKIIDLTMPIIFDHWRWKVEHIYLHSFDNKDICQTSHMSLGAHSFTHVDAPLHFFEGQSSIYEISLQSLVGEAFVVDLSFKEANEPITEEDLKNQCRGLKENDIVLLKTDWDLKQDWRSKDYWEQSPYITREAAKWLVQKQIKAVGFDFPQDYCIRELKDRMPSKEEFISHDVFLPKGIIILEYLCNLHSLSQERVFLIALPLKITGVEGAPARVIALE